MKRIAQIVRLIHINFILARHGLDKVILSLHLFAPLRFLIYLNLWNWFRPKSYQRGAAIRMALQDLGPIFVKFGQALSTRRDLLPDDIANELAKLQDKVPPFCSEKACALVEKAYGMNIDDVFSHFTKKPLASASIAQVHAATLHSGEEVVVKIVRPDIEKRIKRDIELLILLAEFAERYIPEARRLRSRDAVCEFKTTLNDELDLGREAANASQLRRNFDNSKLLYVPEVHWQYSRERVAVFERIHGIPITDIEALRKHNINIKKLAERGVEIFFTQVFRDSFFHADMHPGNIFVSTENPDDPLYICVDFGIIGSLNKSDKRYLAENFHAFFIRDYHKVAELHVESGWVPYDTRVDEFESAIRTVCEPIFERPLKDISFAQMLVRLFQTGRRFNMEVQPQLILLQKTLFAIEGLGRQLYPELDLWSTAKPYLENWLKQQVGPKQFMAQVKEQAPFWLESLPQMPRLIHDVLSDQKQHYIEHKIQRVRHQQHREILHRHKRRCIAYAVGLGLMTAAFLNSDYATTLFKDSFARHNLTIGMASIGLVAIITGLVSRR